MKGLASANTQILKLLVSLNFDILDSSLFNKQSYSDFQQQITLTNASPRVTKRHPRMAHVTTMLNEMSPDTLTCDRSTLPPQFDVRPSAHH